MLQLMLGTNWRTNRDRILDLLAQDVSRKAGGRILLVPEQASHDYERRPAPGPGIRPAGMGGAELHPPGWPCVCPDGGAEQSRFWTAVGDCWPWRRRWSSCAPAEGLRSVGTRPEFLSALVTAVDEFKSCCVTREALQAAARQSEGILAEKAGGAVASSEAYDGICAGFGQTPETDDQSCWSRWKRGVLPGSMCFT